MIMKQINTNQSSLEYPQSTACYPNTALWLSR